MTKEEKYVILRDKLTTASSCSDQELQELKNHYRSKIDSDRRYDRIGSLANLIKILEKRDVLSSNNISALRQIATFLNQSEVINAIDNFDSLHVAAVRQLVEPNFDRVLPRPDSEPIRRVYDLICSNIGQKWKDFARALKIPEGCIDQLEYRHHNKIPEMAREAIFYHKEWCDPRYWKYELCKALDDARRKDLSRDVDRLFAMYRLNDSA